MKYLKLLLCLSLFLIAFVGGCADTHRISRYENTGTRLLTTDKVCIAVPRDGIYGDRQYLGSGRTTAQVINSAFAEHVNNTQMLKAGESMEESLMTAKKTGYKYLAYPMILHWEDRATEWSARPDRVEVKITIIEVETGRTIESAIIKGKSGLATFGGDHPQDLLPEPVGEFISSLF
jgi:hypothetical protein